MYLQALLSSLAMLSATCHLNAFPIVSEQSDEVQVPTDNLLNDAVGFGPDDPSAVGLRHTRALTSAFSAGGDGAGETMKGGWWKGTKGALSEDSSENLAEDVKAILWKLAATERLRSPAFIKVNQALQKTNKRACFWKYCVSK